MLSHVCMARAFLVWRRASRAFEYLDQRAGRRPEQLRSAAGAGGRQAVQGDFDAARTAYERTLAVKASGDAYLGLALVHSVQNQARAWRSRPAQGLRRRPARPGRAVRARPPIAGAEAVQLLRDSPRGPAQLARGPARARPRPTARRDAAGAEAVLGRWPSKAGKPARDRRLRRARWSSSAGARRRSPCCSTRSSWCRTTTSPRSALARLYEQTSATKRLSPSTALRPTSSARARAAARRRAPRASSSSARCCRRALLDKALERAPALGRGAGAVRRRARGAR